MFKLIKYQRIIQKTVHYNYCTKEMKYLNVAEKNDAAKTISAQLSNGTARRREGFSKYNKIYEFEATVKGTKSKMVMTSVSGHLLHLEFLTAYRNWHNVNPQSLFDVPVQKACSKDFEPIKRTLEREIRSCQGLIIWTDCDREGENIGFEIVDVCRTVKPNITVHRAIFSEITSAAVRRALQNLSIPDKLQSVAVDVRTELDLRTGAAITRFQTMRLQKLFPENIADKLISYGSCQIPTLGFVAERYKEIEAFVSEPFWKIKVTHTIDDLTVEFLWARNRLFDKQACEDYYILVLSNPKATVESVTVKPKHKWRPTPMDTVELEKLGSRKLKLSAKEIMTIAEKLYTKGIISYPRTETNMFSKDINLTPLVEQQVNHSIWGSFAQRIMEWGGPNPRNGNKSDQAHPPIHPTKMVTDLGGNEARVYELICRHFLACVSKDAVGSETIVNITIEGEKFSATGLVIYERNYLDIYIYEKWNAKQIHHYVQGQVFTPTEITMPEGATTAPALLTEADLIALMEKHGIGTDATHAEHINTIKERGYIGVVEKGCLVPGVIGMGLYEGYDAMQLALAKPLLRAEFEVDLKRICLGEKDAKVVLQEHIQKYKEAYKQIMDNVTALDEKMANRINEAPSNTNAATGTAGNLQHFQELCECPKCAIAPLTLKQKKNQNSFFIGCLNYPVCKNVIWLPDECKEPKVLDEHCDKCGARYKLLQLKFAQIYHKTIFNTPTGCYKTCLRCDVKFRNTFNINVDCVKATGPIVSNVQQASSNIAPSDRNNVNEGNTKKKPSSGKIGKRKKENSHGSNIRSYFTSVEQIAETELSNVPLDEFFNDDDHFTHAINNCSSSLQTTTTTTSSSNRQNYLAELIHDDDDDIFNNIEVDLENQEYTDSRHVTNIDSSTTATNSRINVNLDDSISTIIRNDDHDDDNYVWGTAARNACISQNSSTVTGSQIQTEQSAKRRKNAWDSQSPDYSCGSSGSHAFRAAPEQNIKCNLCQQPAKELCVKKDGPNKGRFFYVCSKNNPCKFFQWADEIVNNENVRSANNTHASSSVDSIQSTRTAMTQIKCNCNQPALSLTVRKEGPTKGKSFYSCANRIQSCGFFKWAESEESLNLWDNSTASGSSRFNNRTTNRQNRTTSESNIPKTRKCGLCRQVGHSRQKCPRKAEFEF